MVRKNIRITEQAYKLLTSLKKNDKTRFSDVILEHYPIPELLSDSGRPRATLS